MFRLVLILTGVLLSTTANADHRHWRGHGHHRHHHEHYYPSYREEIIYVPRRRIVEYVPAPRYYAPPPPPPVRYYQYDQRSPQGLLGGVVGSAMGYEIGRGDPLAAGIGAAAGAWFGNGRY